MTTKTLHQLTLEAARRSLAALAEPEGASDGAQRRHENATRCLEVLSRVPVLHDILVREVIKEREGSLGKQGGAN